MSGIPNADWTIKFTFSVEETAGKIQPAHSFLSITFSSPSIWVQFYATFITVNDLPQEMKLPKQPHATCKQAVAHITTVKYKI